MHSWQEESAIQLETNDGEAGALTKVCGHASLKFPKNQAKLSGKMMTCQH